MKWIVLTIFSFFMFSGVVGCTQIEEPNSPSTIIESESADDSRSAKTRSMELPNTDREFNPYSQINLQTAYDKLKNDLGLPDQRFFKKSEWTFYEYPVKSGFIDMGYCWTFEILPEDVSED